MNKEQSTDDHSNGNSGLWRHGKLARQQRNQSGRRPGRQRARYRPRAAGGGAEGGTQGLREPGSFPVRSRHQLRVGGHAQPPAQILLHRGPSGRQACPVREARNAIGGRSGRNHRGVPRDRPAFHRAPEPPVGPRLSGAAQGHRVGNAGENILHREQGFRQQRQVLWLARLSRVRRRHGAGLGRSSHGPFHIHVSRPEDQDRVAHFSAWPIPAWTTCSRQS